MACACMRRPPSACAFALARLRAPAQPALPHAPVLAPLRACCVGTPSVNRPNIKALQNPGDGLLSPLRSTISTDWLNFRVRNGNGCGPVV